MHALGEQFARAQFRAVSHGGGTAGILLFARMPNPNGLWMGTQLLPRSAPHRGTDHAITRTMHAQLGRRLGFTLIELLVVVAVLAVLAGGLLPALTKARAKQRRIACVGNLKIVGLGFRIYAADHNDRLPTAAWANRDRTGVATVVPAHYYRMMSNGLTTQRVLWCPSDTRKPVTNWDAFSTANVSYFIGLGAQETFPQMLLAGDRNLTVNGTPVSPGLLGVTTNMTLGWGADMHRHRGNIALGDGSVQQLTDTRLRSQVAQSGAGTNWLAVP